MAMFSYQAIAGDRAVCGRIRSDSLRQARDRLRAQGLQVRGMAEVRQAAAWSAAWGRRPEEKVTSFIQELSTLLSAGIPLLESLDAIASQYRGRFAASLMMLREGIAAGTSLAQAMRQQPFVFDELCVCMVDVGQSTGMLDPALAQLAAYRRRSEQLKGRIGTALIYPAIVSCAGIAVTVFLCTFVVPRLLEALVDAGKPLPLATRLVKAVSDLLLQYGWALAMAMAGGVVVTALALRRPVIRRLWHRQQLRLPLIGKLLRLQAVVRVAVMLATLMRSGMEFVQALHMVAKAIPNLVIQEALERCEAAIAAGQDIGPALAATGAFPEPVVRVMEVGQATGHLDQMLERLAADYDLQVQTATARLVAILEPAMILLLACLVGFIVLSIILPYLEAGNVL